MEIVEKFTLPRFPLFFPQFAKKRVVAALESTGKRQFKYKVVRYTAGLRVHATRLIDAFDSTGENLPVVDRYLTPLPNSIVIQQPMGMNYYYVIFYGDLRIPLPENDLPAPTFAPKFKPTLSKAKAKKNVKNPRSKPESAPTLASMKRDLQTIQQQVKTIALASNYDSSEIDHLLDLLINSEGRKGIKRLFSSVKNT